MTRDTTAFARISHAWELLSPDMRLAFAEMAELAAGGTETATGIGLGPALAEMDAVIGDNQKKHPGKSWAKKTIADHLSHLESHIKKFKAGQMFDEETRRLTMAHAMARCAMICGLQKKAKRL